MSVTLVLRLFSVRPVTTSPRAGPRLSAVCALSGRHSQHAGCGRITSADLHPNSLLLCPACVLHGGQSRCTSMRQARTRHLAPSEPS